MLTEVNFENTNGLVKISATLGDNRNYPEAQKNDPDTQTQIPKRLQKKKFRLGDRTPCRDFTRYPNLG